MLIYIFFFCELVYSQYLNSDSIVSVLGHYAFRRPDTGSWFIDALCQVLSSPEAENQSLNKLLTAVIQYVSVVKESRGKDIRIIGKKQSPCFASMLTKDIYFKSKYQTTEV